jgi:hypothetical protein
MSRLRAFLIALTIVTMAAAPLLVPLIGMSAPNSTRAYAATALSPLLQDNDDEGDNDDGDNNDGGDNDDGADNDNRDNNNNNNSDENDNGDDDDGGSVVPASAPPVRQGFPDQRPTAACSTPGQEMTFQSGDGRILVHVFGTMSQSVKFSIRHPIDPASVPPAPGQVVGGLLFQLIAEACDGTPIATLPAEVNLGIRYTDAEAAGLNEANFTVARLDTTANQWRTAEKQAADPPNNLTSATVSEMGYYVLYQRS